MRHLLSIDDLRDDEIDLVLERAREIEVDTGTTAPPPFVLGELFLSASLRTRVGFAVAAQRMGGSVVEAHEARWTPAMSNAESFDDTLRTLTGMVDLLVCRTPFRLDRQAVDRCARAPVINGGDTDGEHPSQALIDLAAMAAVGEICDLRIGIIGDLSARVTRSLLALLARRPPAELRLSGPGLADEVHLPASLAPITTRPPETSLGGLDIVYLVGLPAQVGDRQLTAGERRRYALTVSAAQELAPHATVLSPLPLIDEIDPEVRQDPRVAMFEQSDRGVWVRAALLELLLADRRT